MDLPLGLIALNWVRMFLPLVDQQLPQRPANTGPDGLRFAKAAFRALTPLGIAAQDLRIGARFGGHRAETVARALTDAKSAISQVPANFISYPNSSKRVFGLHHFGRLGAATV